jgi:putative inorganic carbon (hco3(-)) transporter
LSRVDLSVIVVVGMFLQLFSGNWSLMGIPLPLDRVVLAVALIVLVLKGARWVCARRLVLRPLHLALLCAAAWAAASGIIAGTVFGHLGFYSLLDRFGLVPFALFTLAPLIFGTAKQRNTLIIGLVAIGLYLGATGVFEGLHIWRLVFPSYIADPNVGIQFGRARGPILESTGDGFCILCGMAGAAIALTYWRSQWARLACYLTIVLGGAALFFTLTRSVWIGGFLGIVGSLLLARQTRRILVPVLLVGTVAVVATLAVSPGIRAEALGRTESQSPVWDRENTDLAALKIIAEHPLTGVGWENFINVSGQYMRQQPDYPITGLGLEVHNVFLSHAAELGIPGLLLWLLGFGGALWRAFSPFPWSRAHRSTGSPRSPPEDWSWRDPWRMGGVAIVLCFFVIANLAPFSQALPNALLWTWLGVLAIPYTSELRRAPAHARERAALTLGPPPQLAPAHLRIPVSPAVAPEMGPG